MAILLVEDATGAVVVAMGEDFDRWEAEISADEPLLLRGAVRMDRDEDGTRVSLRLGTGRRGETPDPDERLVERLSVVREQRSSGLELTAPARAINADRLHALNSLLRTAKHAGTCQTWLSVQTADRCVVKLKLPVTVTPSDDLDEAVRRVFGGAVEVRTT
ncbi:MAG: hypothetical protein R3F43_24640 [bacterium]